MFAFACIDIYVFAFAFKQHWGKAYAFVSGNWASRRNLIIVSYLTPYTHGHCPLCPTSTPPPGHTHTHRASSLCSPYTLAISTLSTRSHTHSHLPLLSTSCSPLAVHFISALAPAFAPWLQASLRDPVRAPIFPAAPCPLPTLAFSPLARVLEGFSGQPAPPAVSEVPCTSVGPYCLQGATGPPWSLTPMQLLPHMSPGSRKGAFSPLPVSPGPQLSHYQTQDQEDLCAQDGETKESSGVSGENWREKRRRLKKSVAQTKSHWKSF